MTPRQKKQAARLAAIEFAERLCSIFLDEDATEPPRMRQPAKPDGELTERGVELAAKALARTRRR